MSSPWDDRQHRVPTTHHMANMPVLPPISDSHFAPMSMRGQQASSMRPPMQLQQYPSGPGDLPPHSMRVPVHPPIRSQVPPPPVGGHSVSSYDRVVMPAPELETLIKSNVSDSNDVPTAFNLLSRFGVTTLNELEGMLRDLEKIRRSLPSEEEGRVLTLIAETYMNSQFPPSNSPQTPSNHSHAQPPFQRRSENRPRQHQAPGRENDQQSNSSRYNDSRYNDSRHNSSRHNDSRYNDSRHNSSSYDRHSVAPSHSGRRHHPRGRGPVPRGERGTAFNKVKQGSRYAFDEDFQLASGAHLSVLRQLDVKMVVENPTAQQASAHNEFKSNPILRWDDPRLKLHTSLQYTLQNVLNWQYPLPIQSHSIFVDRIFKRDIFGISCTGSGKTAAYGVPILQALIDEFGPKVPNNQEEQEAKTRLQERKQKLQHSEKLTPLAFVVIPTAELSEQVARMLLQLIADTDFSVAHCCGGTNYLENYHAAKQSGADILIGTPGRLHHMFEDGKLSFEELRVFVVDEADYLLRADKHGDLDTEHVDRLAELHDAALEVRQDWRRFFFSATCTPEVLEITNQMLESRIDIRVGCNNFLSPTVHHVPVHVIDPEEGKQRQLFDLLREHFAEQLQDGRHKQRKAIVFVNSSAEAEYVAEFLHEYADQLSRDTMEWEAISRAQPYSASILSPGEREQVAENFRRRKLRVLIATDVLGRGFEAPQVSAVIHYDLPIPLRDASFASAVTTFVQRSGRTGRAGNIGLCYSFWERNNTDHERMAAEVVPLLKEMLPLQHEFVARTTDSLPEFLMQMRHNHMTRHPTYPGDRY